MKIKRFTLLTLPFFAIAIGLIALSNSNEAKYFPREYGENIQTSAQGYLEYMQSIKANQLTGEVNPEDVIAAAKHVKRMPKAKASLGLFWQFEGPDNVGGRARALLVDKNNPNHIYAGSVAGGLFESFNGAQSWQPYDSSFTVNLISSITQGVDGSVYVGTGGHFESLSSQDVNTNRKGKGYFFIGSGLHKLTGNGTYETIVEPSSRVQVAQSIDFTTIGEVAASKVDNDIIWVAMNNGLRKIDMSNNTTVITNPISITANQTCDDIKISENDSVIVVTFSNRSPSSGNGRIFVSHDQGQTFTETTPQGSFRRIETAIASTDNKIVYAAATNNNNCLANIYRSRDAGLTWEIIGPGGALNFDMYAQPSGGSSCQGGWDNMIEVFPDDAGKIIVGGITLYRWEQSSKDPEPANGLWTRLDVISMFNENINPLYVHADKHAIAFDPRNSDVAYIATDGGITKSTNMNSELPTYTAHNYKFGVTQFYGMDVNGEGVIMAGAQDNGTQLVGLKFNNNLGGTLANGGDGFDAALSNIDTSVGVATSQFNRLSRVQGIGTTSMNSNLAIANITNTNVHMSSACGTNIGCSPVFYSSIEFWESFNHLSSTDYVDIINSDLSDELINSLPPIHLNTIIPFESNNNARIIQKRKVDTSWYWPDVDRYWNITSIDTIPDLQNGIYPTDTIPTDSGRFDTLLLNGANNQIVVNFDTFMVDTLNQIVQINRRTDTGAVISVNYNSGTEYVYNNLLIGSNYDVRFMVDTFTSGNQTGDSYLRVEDMSIRFRYFQLDTIRTGIYPLDTISAGSGRFDTLILDSSFKMIVVNFDTFSVDLLNQQINLDRRADSNATINVNYTIGNEYNYKNLLIGDGYDVTFKVDTFTFGELTSTPYLIVEEMNIQFRYSFKVQDRIQTMLASANWPGRSADYSQRNVFMTRDLLKGNTDILWHYIAGAESTPDPITNTVIDMKFTPDGNHLFIGTVNGELFRVSGLNEIVKTGMLQSSGANFSNVIQALAGKCHKIGDYSGRSVTDIAIDPNNSDNVIVALGNYGNHANVARIYNATTITDPIGNFDYIQGTGNTALPTAPAYSVMIDYRDPNKVLIGNDFGVFVTENAFDPTAVAVEWTEENTGLGHVPVFEIKQVQEYFPYVKNSGAVYIATHGRGVYRADQLVGIGENENGGVVESKTFKTSLKFFPNPVKSIASLEFKIEDINSAVLVEIYNIRGQKVKEEQLNRLIRGTNKRRLNLSDLDHGTYIIRAVHKNQVFSSKFIKQ